MKLDSANDRVNVSVSYSFGPESTSKSRVVSDPLSKRVFDISLASMGLGISAPLWALISVLIWLEDGPPILLVQERVGKRGKLFRLFKFRTMERNAQADPVVEDQEDDPRVTQMGKILRATALDELPQLFNILKGDMSFVGPRAFPLIIEDKEKSRYKTVRDIEGYDLRSAVRPGLTGVAQIFAPKDTPRRNKFRYDILYIRRWSFWLDLKLITLSFWITFRGKWETRGRKV